MKKIELSSQIVLKDKAYLAEDLINTLICLPGLSASEVFLKHNFTMPKKLRMDILKEIQYENVLEIVNAKLTIADETKYSLSWFQTYSEFQLEKLLASFQDDNLNYDYLRSLWLNILSYMIKNRANQEIILELLNEARKVEQKITNNILRYNLALVKVFADKPGEFDGLTPDVFRPVLYKSATISEIRELGKKYDINVPQRLRKAEFLELIFDELRKTNRLKKEVEEELVKMTIMQLQRFCINNKLKLSIDLKKESIIEYILAKAKIPLFTYNRPSDSAIYEIEPEDLGFDPASYFKRDSIFKQDIHGRPLYEKIDVPKNSRKNVLIRPDEDIVIKPKKDPKEEVVVEKIIVKKEQEQPKKDDIKKENITIIKPKEKEDIPQKEESQVDKDLLLAYIEIKKRLKGFSIDLNDLEDDMDEFSKSTITTEDLKKIDNKLNYYEKQINNSLFDVEELKVKYEDQNTEKAKESENEIIRITRDELARINDLRRKLDNLEIYYKTLTEKEKKEQQEKEEELRKQEEAKIALEEERKRLEAENKKLQEEKEEAIKVAYEASEEAKKIAEEAARKQEEMIEEQEEEEEFYEDPEEDEPVVITRDSESLDFEIKPEETSKVEVTNYTKDLREQEKRREEELEKDKEKEQRVLGNSSWEDDYYNKPVESDFSRAKPVIIENEKREIVSKENRPVSEVDEKGLLTEEESIDEYWNYRERKERKTKEQILKEEALNDTIYQEETKLIEDANYKPNDKKQNFDEDKEKISKGQLITILVTSLVAVLAIVGVILFLFIPR